MVTNSKIRFNRYFLGIMLSLSMVLFVLAASAYRYQLNPDGISYISIAQQYMNGQFETAINGFWSPLISWLLVPLLAIGIDAQVAFVSINVLAAFISLIIGLWIVAKATKNSLYSMLLFWALATPFLIKTIRLTTPDGLLLTTLLLLVATIIYIDENIKVNSTKKFKLKIGICLGLVAALAYFTKIVALPVYLGVLLAWVVLRTIVYKDKLPDRLLSKKSASYILVVPAISIMTFIIAVAPWSFALSQKYGYFTIGSSIEVHATAQISGGSVGGEQGLLSLTIPPHQYSYTSAEERTPYAEERLVRNIERKDNESASIWAFIHGKVSNLPAFLSKVSNVSSLILPTIFILLLAIALRKVAYKKDQAVFILAIFMAVYMAGFVLIAGSSGGIERYYWPLAISGFALISIISQGLWKLVVKQAWLRQSLFISLTLVLPFVSVLDSRPYAFGNPIEPDAHVLATQVLRAGHIEPSSKLASNNRGPMRRVAFYLNSQTYGSIGNRDFSSDEVQQALRSYGINYYFHFYPSKEQDGLGLENIDARKVQQIEFDAFNCQDVRYGELGVDLDQEPCTIEVIQLIY